MIVMTGHVQWSHAVLNTSEMKMKNKTKYKQQPFLEMKSSPIFYFALRVDRSVLLDEEFGHFDVAVFSGQV